MLDRHDLERAQSRKAKQVRTSRSNARQDGCGGHDIDQSVNLPSLELMAARMNEGGELGELFGSKDRMESDITIRDARSNRPSVAN